MSSTPAAHPTTTTRRGRPRRPPTKTELIFARVHPDEREAVVKAAEAGSRSLSQQVRHYVRAGLAQEADRESA